MVYADGPAGIGTLQEMDVCAGESSGVRTRKLDLFNVTCLARSNRGASGTAQVDFATGQFCQQILSQDKGLDLLGNDYRGVGSQRMSVRGGHKNGCVLARSAKFRVPSPSQTRYS